MSEPNYDARDAAIALELMGLQVANESLYWNPDKDGDTIEFRPSQDPVAANRVLEKLKPIVDVTIKSGVNGLKDWVFIECPKNKIYILAEADADTWMQALVLACTEVKERRASPEEMPGSALNDAPSADYYITTARVRPELMKESNTNK